MRQFSLHRHVAYNTFNQFQNAMCRFYDSTTSSLCTEIRLQHVEAGRSVSELQQNQKVKQLNRLQRTGEVLHRGKTHTKHTHTQD